MAPLPVSASSGVDVLLVRHGESSNNVIMAEAYAKHGLTPEGRAAADAEFLARRFDDPPLSARGEAEAQALVSLTPSLQAQGCVVFVSPFLRTLQTAAPLVAALGGGAVCHPDVYEAGGCYHERDGGRDGPGQCLTAEEIRERFPGFDTSRLPAEGGWYSGSWEDDAAGRARGRRVAEWLLSPELKAEVGGKALVLVVHAHFIDYLLKGMLGLPDEAASDVPENNTFAHRPYVFVSPNASLARLRVGAETVIMRSFADTAHLAGLTSSL